MSPQPDLDALRLKNPLNGGDAQQDVQIPQEILQGISMENDPFRTTAERKADDYRHKNQR